MDTTDIDFFHQEFRKKFEEPIFRFRNSTGSLSCGDQILTLSQDHLPGIFCRLEYKLESKSGLAPRFRLGSLQYTEWMEGKRRLPF